MENEMSHKDPHKDLIVKGETSLFFDMARFSHAEKVASIFANSDMVPKHFQNNKANCIIALNLAERFQADPFMVMQNIYIVHGRPGIEGKLVIALVNSTGKFSALQYDFNKEEKECFAFATRHETGEVCKGPVVSIAMAKAEGWLEKQGSKWKTMPGLMLRYRAATFFARTFCPEALLGMQTKEELFDFVDVEPDASGKFAVPKTAEDLTEELKKDNNQKEARPDKFESHKVHPADGTTEFEKKLAEKNKQLEIDKQFRAEWINLKSGFPEYIKNHIDKFNEASPDLIFEAQQKWHRLIEMQTIPDAPWPLDEKLKKADNEIFEINGWIAWDYLKDDADFNRFKEAYENLGYEVYKQAMLRLGWKTIATSEECRIVADRMATIADIETELDHPDETKF